MDKIRKIGLLVMRNGSFLVNRKYGSKWFLLPGGRVEAGESDEECLVREIREEHGCGIKGPLKFFGEFEDIAANEPDTTVSVKLYSGDLDCEPVIGSEIEELKWFGPGDDPAVLSSLISQKLIPALKAKNLL